MAATLSLNIADGESSRIFIDNIKSVKLTNGGLDLSKQMTEWLMGKRKETIIRVISFHFMAAKKSCDKTWSDDSYQHDSDHSDKRSLVIVSGKQHFTLTDNLNFKKIHLMTKINFLRNK